MADTKYDQFVYGVATITIVKNKKVSITCPRCRLTSYNPNDINHMYCGNCHVFYPFAQTDTKDDVNGRQEQRR